MSEWPGTLTRIDAIRIIENITDKDDPAWEWAVEDFYDEETDTFPTLYEVLQTLGVTEAEYKSATNAQNTNWPEVSGELYISQQVRIDSLESELSTLKAESATLRKAIYDMEASSIGSVEQMRETGRLTVCYAEFCKVMALLDKTAEGK